MEKLPTGGAVDQTQKAGHIAVSAVPVLIANQDLHHSNSKIIKIRRPIGTNIYNFVLTCTFLELKSSKLFSSLTAGDSKLSKLSENLADFGT